ncbi:MAG: 4Fe-4S ferredoxin, iron-sulfur binding domain protein [Clostridia bacterium 62_21]|nr:MAG: 4Fe-4S ferredoxin, iron-sulfur binding domain protein [Clostridia bacterium 62_21]
MRGIARLNVKRRLTQFACALLANGYFPGFVSGAIYQGHGKYACVPFLNCHSCPGALGACPVGAFQAILAGPGHNISLYVTGLVTTAGAAVGRAICGWLCPFGFLQELLARPRAYLVRFPRALLALKYVMLVLTVTLPGVWVGAGGVGAPYFCKYVCPAGTLEAGLVLALRDPALRALMGTLFAWKVMLLLLFLVLMVVTYRPFCRTACPLGAFYGLFNGVSFWRLNLDRARCNRCGACRRVCPVHIAVDENPNHPECIRCLDCTRVCPTNALRFGTAEPEEGAVLRRPAATR